MIMREIGGYIELDRYSLPMLHETALALNTGRNCLKYLIKTRGIKKILIPYYVCDAIEDVCRECNIDIRKYHVNKSFEPIVDDIETDEWLYVVNYYGQISLEYMQGLKNQFTRVIFDQAQAYYAYPVPNSDNIYTCRKFFGVPDGAFLYTDQDITKELEQDCSWGSMDHILGRFEGLASDHYERYKLHEKMISTFSLKRMSKLTFNLLRGIEYDMFRIKRVQNYTLLNSMLGETNELNPVIPRGPYMYPLMVKNADKLRKKMIDVHIYVPVLWPNVLQYCDPDTDDYRLASDILPLPCDQRYSEDEMKYMADLILGSI